MLINTQLFRKFKTLCSGLIWSTNKIGVNNVVFLLRETSAYNASELLGQNSNKNCNKNSSIINYYYMSMIAIHDCSGSVKWGETTTSS